MKTASLGLLEVPVVRVVNAPPLPLLVTSRAIPPFFVSSRKFFGEVVGKYFWRVDR